VKFVIQKQRSSEEEFELIGLQSFFDTEDDKNVDWYEFFQLTEDEKYYAANYDQIIEEDKAEDQIWRKYLTPEE